MLQTVFEPRLSDHSVCGLNLYTRVPPRKKEKWSWHAQLTRQNIKMHLWIYGHICRCIEKDGAKYTAMFTGFPLKSLGRESIWTLGFLHFWPFLKACWEPTGGVEFLSYWVSLVWPSGARFCHCCPWKLASIRWGTGKCFPPGGQDVSLTSRFPICFLWLQRLWFGRERCLLWS